MKSNDFCLKWHFIPKITWIQALYVEFEQVCTRLNKSLTPKEQTMTLEISCSHFKRERLENFLVIRRFVYFTDDFSSIGGNLLLHIPKFTAVNFRKLWRDIFQYLISGLIYWLFGRKIWTDLFFFLMNLFKN